MKVQIILVNYFTAPSIEKSDWTSQKHILEDLMQRIGILDFESEVRIAIFRHAT